uniref:Uncharacterized protein n=1 Tax=Arundo donax TaxID=35708 RepID=A0A0A9H8Y7_ARUDO
MEWSRLLPRSVSRKRREKRHDSGGTRSGPNCPSPRSGRFGACLRSCPTAARP